MTIPEQFGHLEGLVYVEGRFNHTQFAALARDLAQFDSGKWEELFLNKELGLIGTVRLANVTNAALGMCEDQQPPSLDRVAEITDLSPNRAAAHLYVSRELQQFGESYSRGRAILGLPPVERSETTTTQ